MRMPIINLAGTGEYRIIENIKAAIILRTSKSKEEYENRMRELFYRYYPKNFVDSYLKNISFEYEYENYKGLK